MNLVVLGVSHVPVENIDHLEVGLHVWNSPVRVFRAKPVERSCRKAAAVGVVGTEDETVALLGALRAGGLLEAQLSVRVLAQFCIDAGECLERSAFTRD